MVEPFDGEELRRWLDAATDALTGARVQDEVGLHNWACFLAEQAGQLALKGLLHGVGAGAWGHDLVDLGEKVAEAMATSLPEDVQAALFRLSRHYIPARYPDAHPAGTPRRHYGPLDSRLARADAERVVEFVDATWRELLRAARAAPAEREDASDGG